jgi:putrescine transport system ATP-binding protein
VRQAVDAAAGATVWLALRPEKVQVRAEPPVAAGQVTVTGVVTDIGYLGKMSIYKVRLDDGFIVEAAIANATRMVERRIAWNDRVWLSFAADAGVVLTR